MRNEKSPIRMSVANAAVESGFYTVVHKNGIVDDSAEQTLAEVEGSASEALRRVISGQFPPGVSDRQALAVFLALQVARTPFQRAVSEEVREALKQKVTELGSDPRAVMDQFGQKIFDEDENVQAASVAEMMVVARELYPVLLNKSWILAKTHQDAGLGIVTSDAPFFVHTPAANRPFGVGIGIANAEEVYLPLSRDHVLCLAQPGSIPEVIIPLRSETVLFVNHGIAENALKFVFQHPDDKPIDDLISGDRRPLLDV